MSLKNATMSTISSEGFIDKTLVAFCMTFNLSICAEVIGLAGIVGNIINILNFRKQGLQDSVNVTLTALALSDIGALFFLLIVNILFNPLWRDVELPFSSHIVLAMVFFYPHGYFIRVSGFITAFAAVERCLCVVMPLDVKRIMTRNVAVVVNVFIFIILLLYLYPEPSVIYMGWVYLPESNRTVITIFPRENFQNVITYANITNDLCIPYITFFILIVSTAIIVFQLKLTARWRQSITESAILSGSSRTELSHKDQKAVVMLTVVSALYVMFLTPQCVLMTVMGLVQSLKIEGQYWDLSLLIYSFTSLLETINCSVSILVYYTMSTKYRKTIQAWFPHFRRKA